MAEENKKKKTWAIMFIDIVNSSELANILDNQDYKHVLDDFHQGMKGVASDELELDDRDKSELESKGYVSKDTLEVAVAGDEMKIFISSEHNPANDRGIYNALDKLLNIAIRCQLRWLGSRTNYIRINEKENKLPIELAIGINIGELSENKEGYPISLAKRLEGLSREGKYFKIFLSGDAYYPFLSTLMLWCVKAEQVFPKEKMKGFSGNYKIFEIKDFEYVTELSIIYGLVKAEMDRKEEKRFDPKGVYKKKKYLGTPEEIADNGMKAFKRCANSYNYGFYAMVGNIVRCEINENVKDLVTIEKLKRDMPGWLSKEYPDMLGPRLLDMQMYLNEGNYEKVIMLAKEFPERDNFQCAELCMHAAMGFYKNHNKSKLAMVEAERAVNYFELNAEAIINQWDALACRFDEHIKTIDGKIKRARLEKRKREHRTLATILKFYKNQYERQKKKYEKAYQPIIKGYKEELNIE